MSPPRKSIAFIVGVAAVIAACPTSAAAQGFPTAIELFDTFGGVAGATPVHVLGGSRVGAHAGFRFDGGIQGERLGLGVGTRLWELAPTRSFGGQGLEGFLQGELRASRDARTTLRVTAGAGFEEIDPGHGPEREHTGTQGFLWSAGVGREFIAPSGALILLSVDVVFPHVNPDIDGRRRPVLELGMGYRSRFSQSIGPFEARRTR